MKRQYDRPLKHQWIHDQIYPNGFSYLQQSSNKHELVKSFRMRQKFLTDNALVCSKNSEAKKRLSLIFLKIIINT